MAKYEEEKTSILTSETLKVHLDKADKTPPSFVLLVGPASSIGKQWYLENYEVSIGRSTNNGVYIDDRSVSKVHAKIFIEKDGTYIVDLESTNKTIVNSQEIKPLERVKLGNNDQIKTGNVIFKFLDKGNIESVSHKKSFDRSKTDALTGAFNKGALNDYAPEAIKRSDLLGLPLSLVVFDIDHFKKVNDTFGHAAGDCVIKDIARLVKDKLTRSEDFFARFGGEEFVIVLTGSTKETATHVAERVRVSIEAYNFMFETKSIPVTVSLGVATREPKAQSWKEIFELADQALYKAKARGRNQVAIS